MMPLALLPSDEQEASNSPTTRPISHLSHLGHLGHLDCTSIPIIQLLFTAGVYSVKERLNFQAYENPLPMLHYDSVQFSAYVTAPPSVIQVPSTANPFLPNKECQNIQSPT